MSLNRYYFFINPSATRNALNSISRLWWGIHQTVNYDLADRYQYSRILFENSETFQSITQRNDLFNNKKVLIDPKGFEFYSNYCTLPTSLVVAYALAIATSGQAQQILLAGFDGFSTGVKAIVAVSVTLPPINFTSVG